MRSLQLTANDFIRALTNIDDAVRNKADALAERLRRRGLESRIESRGTGRYAVIAAGTNLFSREFGGVETQPEGLIGGTIEDLKADGLR